MYRIPNSVKKEAIIALIMHNNGFKGTTETGLNRAKQLATNNYISKDDAINMKNWFARHNHTSKPNYDLWVNKGKPILNTSKGKWRGAKSYLAWGGESADKWLKSLNLR